MSTTLTAPEMAIKDQNELQRLVRDIVDGHETVQQLYAFSIKKACQTVSEAVNLGRNLIAAKEIVEHGGWKRFCRERCKMEPGTAWRYMKIAEKASNLPPGGDLDDTPAIDLFREIGIRKPKQIEAPNKIKGFTCPLQCDPENR